MRYGGLFEGIGGFALAASWMGWEPVWSNEIDSFCCRVLEKNFNHRIIKDDIRNIGKHNLESVDIICGGFPCQPFSTAGARTGKDDNRYLWPEKRRIIQEIRPSIVVAENVHGLLSQGNGLVFETVCSEMEAEGYEVQTVILPACSVQAQHRRDRIWIVGFLSDSCSFRWEQRKAVQDGQQFIGWRETQRFVDSLYRNDSRNYICNESEFSGIIDGIPNQLDRVRALGNAIVPQLAYALFKAIEQTICVMEGGEIFSFSSREQDSSDKANG